MYQFTIDVTYDPDGDAEKQTFYPSGKKDTLKSWKKAHIKNALAAGLIVDLSKPSVSLDENSDIMKDESDED